MLVGKNIPLPYLDPKLFDPNIVSPEIQSNTNNTNNVSSKEKPTNSKKIDKEKAIAEYKKAVESIAIVKINGVNNTDNILNSLFLTGKNLGLNPEDILGQKDIVKKFLPKVGALLEVAESEYKSIQSNASKEGETQFSFTDGVITFKTGQPETKLGPDGKPIPVTTSSQDKNKTEYKANLKDASVGVTTENPNGDKFSTKVSVFDQSLMVSNSDKNGAGQTTSIDLNDQKISTQISDGKNTFGITTQGNGTTTLNVSQKGKGGATFSTNEKTGVTTVAVNSEKLGGVQVTTPGKNGGQTVISTNIKYKDEDNKTQTIGATVRTGDNQGTQVNVKGGKYGELELGINSNGVKAGFYVDGKGGSFNISRSNDAVTQTVDKKGNITTSITDDNKWDAKAVYKDKKYGTIGLNMSKHKADSRVFISANPQVDVVCKKEEIKNLEEEKKKILDTKKSERTGLQEKRLEEINKQIETLETEIQDYGKSIETKTNELMFVPDEDDKSGKPAGHEVAKTIGKGDVYQMNQERTLTFGGEIGAPSNVVKSDTKTSKKVDIDLSVEGLGDNKVKINVSRNVEIDNKTNINAVSGIGTFEGEFGNDASVSYEVVIDLNTQEGKELYDKIMSSTSNFKDKLPIPQESSGVHIVKSETEDVKTKDATNQLKVPSAVTFSVNKESEITKTISQNDYEMTGDFNRTSIQDGEKVPLLGHVFSDEKIITNGNYSITPPKQDQIKALEEKKKQIQDNPNIPQSQKDIEIESIDDKIDDLNEQINSIDDQICAFEDKKTQLTEKQNLPQSEKDSRIMAINKELEERKAKLKTDEPEIAKKKKELEEQKKQINEDKKLTQDEKDTKVAGIDKQITSLNNELTGYKTAISELEQEKVELRYSPDETREQISKLDVKIKELKSDDKTSFKINITDSKVHTGEARRYNRLINNVTDQDNQSSVKTREYNDKSAISINVELFADQDDIYQILNSSKQDFINAAIETPGVNRFGDGVRRLEVKLDKAEEKANKDADEKGLKNPSPEREALIQSARMDVIMNFVARNGKDGVAFLQKLTGGTIEVKTSEVTVDGLKADNIISDDRISDITKKSDEIKSDSKVTRKEAKDIRHMKKEANSKKEDLENKLDKIKNNPMLTESQKAELTANIEEKIIKVKNMIDKLEEVEKMREKALTNK